MKLGVMVEALKQRGRHEEAIIYGTIIPLQLYLRQGLSEGRVMELTLDEIEAQMVLPEKPPRYAGWNFWWGEAACQ